HRALPVLGALHVSRHLLGPDELEAAAGEDEAVARPQASDEAFFHRADAAARKVFHLHRRIRDDGADAEPVPPADAAIGHAIEPVDKLNAVVLGIRRQASSALLDEIERPLEFGARQLAIGPGLAHFVIEWI